MTNTTAPIKTRSQENRIMLNEVQDHVTKILSAKQVTNIGAIEFMLTAERYLKSNTSIMDVLNSNHEGKRREIFNQVYMCALEGILLNGSDCCLVSFDGSWKRVTMRSGFIKMYAQRGYIINIIPILRNDETFQLKYNEEMVLLPSIDWQPDFDALDRDFQVKDLKDPNGIKGFYLTVHDNKPIKHRKLCDVFFMSAEQVHKRQQSAKTKVAWNSWTLEMCWKTVLRKYHAERGLLPDTIEIVVNEDGDDQLLPEYNPLPVIDAQEVLPETTPLEAAGLGDFSMPPSDPEEHNNEDLLEGL